VQTIGADNQSAERLSETRASRDTAGVVDAFSLQMAVRVGQRHAFGNRKLSDRLLGQESRELRGVLRSGLQGAGLIVDRTPVARIFVFRRWGRVLP
jgi:hypothetical protein